MSGIAFRWMGAFCLISGLGLVARARPRDEWPGFRGEFRDGTVAALPPSLDGLKIVWKHDVAGHCDAGMAVCGNKVVFCDHDKINDYFVCLEAGSAKELWKHAVSNGREMEFGAGPRATPLIDHDRVYVLTAFGELYCLKLEDGAEVWQTSFVKDFGVRKPPTWGYCPSPLIAAGKLIVTPGGKMTVAALDPTNGKILWRGQGEGVNYASFIAATFGGVEQVVGFDTTSLGGWELASGKRLWSIKVEPGDGYLVPSPIVVGTRVFVCNRPNGAMLIGFGDGGIANNSPAAVNEEAGGEIASPAKSEGVLIDGAGPIVGLDPTSLKALWTLKDDKQVSGECHLLVSSHRLLAFTEQGQAILCEFDAKGIKFVGATQLSRPTHCHPTLANGRLYVRDDKSLCCYGIPESPK